jgi:hypothetical protein
LVIIRHVGFPSSSPCTAGVANYRALFIVCNEP